MKRLRLMPIVALTAYAILGLLTPNTGRCDCPPPTVSCATGSKADTVLARLDLQNLPLEFRAAPESLFGDVPRRARPLPLVPGLYVLQSRDGQSAQQLIQTLKERADAMLARPGVARLPDGRPANVYLYLEPDPVVRASAWTNDALFNAQWSLHGGEGVAAGADIDAPDAWGLTTGSDDVLVVVADSGVALDEADLQDNLFSNTEECTPDGVDNDCNGFVDDCHGIDLVDCDGIPNDELSSGNALGHGTHVAGIIGAVGNNEIEISGVAPKVKIAACRALDSSGAGRTSDMITCLNYAKELNEGKFTNTAKVVAVNASWGSHARSQGLADAIDQLRVAGILVIASADDADAFIPLDEDGSGGGYYPASFLAPNIIKVTSSGKDGERSCTAGYGSRAIDILAPGESILSLQPAKTPGATPTPVSASGTSMAVPHVTGVAALLKAYDSNLTWQQIRNRILLGGDVVKTTHCSATPGQETSSGRRLDAYGALNLTRNPVPIQRRLAPATDSLNIGTDLGKSLLLSALDIKGGAPDTSVDVVVDGGSPISLYDDGKDGDLAGGDGIYSKNWTPPAKGKFKLTFPDGSKINISVN